MSKQILEPSFGYNNFYYSFTRCISAANEVEINREVWETEAMWRIKDSRKRAVGGNLGWYLGSVRKASQCRG